MSGAVKARRARKHKGYESISRDMLQRKSLSVKARGVLAIFESLPDDWEVNGVQGFIDQFCEKDGYDSINGAIKELEAEGFFARLKRQGSGGRWEWLWSYSHDVNEVAEAVADWEAQGYRTTGKRGGNKAAATPKQRAETKEPAGQDDVTVLGKPVNGAAANGAPVDGAAAHGEPPNNEEIYKRDLQPQDKTSSEAAPPREDVERLCRLLRDKMIDNGCKPPTITKAWRDSARLLLDKDGRELPKAMNLLEWTQDDPFWKANVQSMAKFRAQYDQLRLRALEDHRRKNQVANPAPKMSTGDARLLRQLAEHEQMFNPDGSFRDQPAAPAARQLGSSRPQLGVRA